MNFRHKLWKLDQMRYIIRTHSGPTVRAFDGHKLTLIGLRLILLDVFINLQSHFLNSFMTYANSIVQRELAPLVIGSESVATARTSVKHRGTFISRS